MKTLFNTLSRAFNFAAAIKEESTIHSAIIEVLKPWVLIVLLTLPCFICFFITEYLR